MDKKYKLYVATPKCLLALYLPCLFLRTIGRYAACCLWILTFCDMYLHKRLTLVPEITYLACDVLKMDLMCVLGTDPRAMWKTYATDALQCRKSTTFNTNASIFFQFSAIEKYNHHALCSCTTKTLALLAFIFKIMAQWGSSPCTIQVASLPPLTQS